MSSLPLALHEVLEQEYVAMYGALAGRPDDKYDEKQIVASNHVRETLARNGLLDGDDLAVCLERLRLNTDPNSDHCPAKCFGSAPQLTNGTALLVENYRHLGPDDRRAVNRRVIDEAFTDAVKCDRDVRLAHLYKAIHDRAKQNPKDARSALCISGGGIRSATFALGVIQGLASIGVLKHFDYLSTVSGGGYIGGWLSSWARRNPRGIAGVEQEIASGDTASGESRALPAKLQSEPRPVRHLREYSNYLSPRLGLLSADAWTLGALYIRNVLLNWLVLLPVLTLLLALPRIYAWALMNVGIRGLPWIVGTVFGTLLMAFLYLGAARPVKHGAEEPFAWGDAETQFIICCVIPLTLGAAAMTLFWALADRAQYVWVHDEVWWLIIGVPLITLLAPCVVYFARFVMTPYSVRRDPASAATEPFKRVFFRLLWEGIGALLGMVVGTGLLVFVAMKIFPHPNDPIPRVAEMLPFLRVLYPQAPEVPLYICLGVPAVLLVFFLQASVFVGISSRWNQDYDREWWGRAGAWLLIFAAGWIVIAGVTVFGPMLVYSSPAIVSALGGAAGIGTLIMGRSAKTPANAKQKGDSGKTAVLTNAGLGVLVPVAVIFLLALISFGTTRVLQIAHDRDIPTRQWEYDAQFTTKATQKVEASPDTGMSEVSKETKPEPVVSVAMLQSMEHLRTILDTSRRDVQALLAFGLIGFIFSFFVGVNRFSMHALYRNRLIRAYLGASRYVRDPNRFTGFDPFDNIQMHHLRPEFLWGNTILDVKRFVEALKSSTDPKSVAGLLWSNLTDRTKSLCEKGVNRAAVDALFQDLNRLIDEIELPRNDVDPTTLEGQSRAVCNRRILDAEFPNLLVAMPPDKLPRPVEQQEKLIEIDKDESPRMPIRAPMHVVNMALNLVSGGNLAWQQRKAESFTVTPLHSGSPFVGYRDSRTYGGDEGISLGTAVAISGAAASPNMGYHSSPALAFVMTLFNVRLGWWLGNPGPGGQAHDRFTRANPSTTLGPMLREAAGKTDDLCPYVYLSDGGHFENLGLYEMIVRRAHHILVSDAGCDPKFVYDDLGNALRKIRIDLGVPIDIERIYMYPRDAKDMKGDAPGLYYAVGTIRYKAVDGPDAVDGTLIYVKPGMYSEDYFPKDVYNYAQESPDFPHEPTSDQFFSESQFESYRALGRHVVDEICGKYPEKDPSARFPRVPQPKCFETMQEFTLKVTERYYTLTTRSSASPRSDPAHGKEVAVLQVPGKG